MNVLMLDEPTNNLDPQAKEALLDALTVYEGTIVMVSHDTDFVAQLMPDRAMLMPDGEMKYFDEELLDFARRTGATTYHVMGTCKMGPDSDPMAVVNNRLEVRGTQGLRVVDASVMPTMPSGNINAPVLMVAEKAADLILNSEG